MSIPVSGDQIPNGRYSEEAGIGKMIPFKEVTEEKLSEAIQALLTDPSYRMKAKELGSLLTDQIDKPLDRAVWWIEYLIRHPKLGEYMRSPVHDLAWYPVLKRRIPRPGIYAGAPAEAPAGAPR